MAELIDEEQLKISLVSCIRPLSHLLTMSTNDIRKESVEINMDRPESCSGFHCQTSGRFVRKNDDDEKGKTSSHPSKKITSSLFESRCETFGDRGFREANRWVDYQMENGSPLPQSTLLNIMRRPKRSASTYFFLSL